jgi:hypothetical protein
MLTLRKKAMSIYVDRESRQWIVRDLEGNFWVVPHTDHPWADRQPFCPTEDIALEPVPGHYRFLLGLPS